MSWQRIRPHVLGVPRRGDDILVSELYDPDDEERFYRPVGGGIEFGEPSTDALVREFREELDVGVDVVSYLGTVENIFTFNGNEGHEVTLVHEVELLDTLDTESAVGHEEDGTTYTVEWQSLDALEEGPVPLYPEGLSTLLTEDVSHVLPETASSHS